MSFTLEDIQQKYPASSYRVSLQSLKSEEIAWLKGEEMGAMRPALCFGLKGVVVFTFGEIEISVQQGESRELPGGSYSIALGTSDAEFVYVWKLPEVQCG